MQRTCIGSYCCYDSSSTLIVDHLHLHMVYDYLCKLIVYSCVELKRKGLKSADWQMQQRVEMLMKRSEARHDSVPPPKLILPL